MTAPPERVDTAAVGAQVVSCLLATPGLRVEQLGLALQVPTSDLKPIVKKLVNEKMLRAEGNTRGRRYFATRRATSATRGTRKAASAGRKSRRKG